MFQVDRDGQRDVLTAPLVPASSAAPSYSLSCQRHERAASYAFLLLKFG